MVTLYNEYTKYVSLLQKILNDIEKGIISGKKYY